MWCSSSLALGPVLAAALSYVLGKASMPDDSVVYFMAGFSPRLVASFVANLAKKRMGISPAANVPAPRVTPVTQVKGITPEIAKRLEEEGILDLHGLAMADPLRLIRNTNFDKRLIVSWIDEAILITTLPERWQSLEKDGVTGAVDLVSLVYRLPTGRANPRKKRRTGTPIERCCATTRARRPTMRPHLRTTTRRCSRASRGS